jgi:hypothetical protein
MMTNYAPPAVLRTPASLFVAASGQRSQCSMKTLLQGGLDDSVRKDPNYRRLLGGLNLIGSYVNVSISAIPKGLPQTCVCSNK